MVLHKGASFIKEKIPADIVCWDLLVYYGF